LRNNNNNNNKYTIKTMIVLFAKTGSNVVAISGAYTANHDIKDDNDMGKVIANAVRT
jgi:hypothetical protein